MAKKATKKATKKVKQTSKEVKALPLPIDYEVVAFVIPLPEKSKMPIGEFEGIVHSMYINKYGAQIGGLVQIEGTNDFISLDLDSFGYFLSPESIGE